MNNGLKPSVRQHISMGLLRIPARTERQIKDAINNVFNSKDEEDIVHKKQLMKELGLE